MPLHWLPEPRQLVSTVVRSTTGWEGVRARQRRGASLRQEDSARLACLSQEGSIPVGPRVKGGEPKVAGRESHEGEVGEVAIER